MRAILIWASAAAAIGTAGRYLVAVVRWTYKRAHNMDLMADFVRTMRTNDLPHIYRRLGRIEDGLGLPREESLHDSSLPTTRDVDP